MIERYVPKIIKIPVAEDHVWDPRKTNGIIYGTPGCGKTSEIWKLHKAGLKVLVLDFDKCGTIGRNIASLPISCYEELMDCIYTIKERQFDIVVIDSVDMMYEILDIRTCEDLGIPSVAQGEWGTGWSYLKKLIKTAIITLTDKNIHTIFIGHCKNVSTIDKDKKKTSQVKLNLRDDVYDFIAGLCAYVLYMKVMGDERVIHTMETSSYHAKDRTRWPNGKKCFRNGMLLDEKSNDLTNVFLKAFGRDEVK